MERQKEDIGAPRKTLCGSRERRESLNKFQGSSSPLALVMEAASQRGVRSVNAGGKWSTPEPGLFLSAQLLAGRREHFLCTPSVSM